MLLGLGKKKGGAKPQISADPGGLGAMECLRDLAGHVFDHVTELRQAFACHDDGRKAALARMRQDLARCADGEMLRTHVRETARLLRDLLWEIRDEREQEQEQLSQITGLVSQTIAELNGLDSKLEGSASSQLAKIEEASQSESPQALRTALVGAVQELRSAFKEHSAERSKNSRRMDALVSALREELEKAREEGGRDGLTDLFNRGAFEDEAKRRLNRVAARLDTCGLLMVDVDHFKLVNDTYGHVTGDKALRHVADTMVRTCFRKDDFVARYGGEEFTIVLPGIKHRDLALVSERIRDQIERSKIDSDTGQRLALTVSIGAALAVEGDTVASLVSRADASLYEAKQAGRNRVVVASSSSAAF